MTTTHDTYPSAKAAIRAARGARSQRHLAEIAELSIATVQAIEAGRRPATRNELKSIGYATGAGVYRVPSVMPTRWTVEHLTWAQRQAYSEAAVEADIHAWFRRLRKRQYEVLFTLYDDARAMRACEVLHAQVFDQQNRPPCALDRERQAIHHALKGLIRKGLVRRIERGVYETTLPTCPLETEVQA